MIYKFLSFVFLCMFGATATYAGVQHSKLNEMDETVRNLESSMQDQNGIILANVAEISKLNDTMLELSSKNSDLEKMLRAKNEEAKVLIAENVDWKGKYVRIIEARQDIVAGGTTDVPAQIPQDCVQSLADVRVKVTFDRTEDYLHVQGFTLTNPSYAETKISWVRPLKLSIVIAKDENDKFTAYSKTDEADFAPSNLKIVMDKSVYKTPWYKKISFGTEFAASGNSTAFSANAKYDFEKLSIGPTWIGYDKLGQITNHFGIAASFYPWK